MRNRQQVQDSPSELRANKPDPAVQVAWEARGAAYRDGCFDAARAALQRCNVLTAFQRSRSMRRGWRHSAAPRQPNGRRSFA